jgi:hypothetical protein
MPSGQIAWLQQQQIAAYHAAAEAEQHKRTAFLLLMQSASWPSEQTVSETADLDQTR